MCICWIEGFEWLFIRKTSLESFHWGPGQDRSSASSSLILILSWQVGMKTFPKWLMKLSPWATRWWWRAREDTGVSAVPPELLSIRRQLCILLMQAQIVLGKQDLPLRDSHSLSHSQQTPDFIAVGSYQRSRSLGAGRTLAWHHIWSPGVLPEVQRQEYSWMWSRHKYKNADLSSSGQLTNCVAVLSWGWL